MLDQEMINDLIEYSENFDQDWGYDEPYDFPDDGRDVNAWTKIDRLSDLQDGELVIWVMEDGSCELSKYFGGMLFDDDGTTWEQRELDYDHTLVYAIDRSCAKFADLNVEIDSLL